MPISERDGAAAVGAGDAVGGIDGSGNFQVLSVDTTGVLGVRAGSGYTSVGDGRKAVSVAGTRETLVAATTACKSVIITAETDNTGIIVVGGVTVVAALATRRGTPLSAGESAVFPVSDLVLLYLDTTVSTDGVTYTYFG